MHSQLPVQRLQGLSATASHEKSDDDAADNVRLLKGLSTCSALSKFAELQRDKPFQLFFLMIVDEFLHAGFLRQQG